MNDAEKRRQREVQAHLVRAVLAAHEEGSAPPELLDLVGGSTIEEVDASLAKVKATSAQLVQRARQEQVRPSDVDPAWQFNQAQGYGDRQPLSAEAVAALDMQGYRELRQRLGIGGKPDQGIFAGLR